MSTRCLMIGFMGWFCLLVFTGCAPKRVVSTPVKSDPEVVPEQAPEPSPVQNQPLDYRVGTAAASLAIEQIGKIYRYGSAGPSAFDCSGLVFYIYGSQGISMPRTVHRQAKAGRQIARSQLIPGDLLFFALDGDQISHVGIYIGRGDFVHAPHTGDVVRKESLDNRWWKQRVRSIRRVF